MLRRAERRAAQREGRPVRTLQELDFLLGVADVARRGALRFRWEGAERFEAPVLDGVPSIVHVGCSRRAIGRCGSLSPTRTCGSRDHLSRRPTRRPPQLSSGLSDLLVM